MSVRLWTILSLGNLCTNGLLMFVALIIVATWKPRRGKRILLIYLLLSLVQMVGSLTFMVVTRFAGIGRGPSFALVYQLGSAFLGAITSVLLVVYVILEHRPSAGEIRYVLVPESKPKADASSLPSDGH